MLIYITISTYHAIREENLLDNLEKRMKYKVNFLR